MRLTLGFSPCPNDCFIFDAIVNKKIDTAGIEFEVVMEDVETLNKMAAAGALSVTKLSFHALAGYLHNYVLLNSGSALGFGCGPLLISKRVITKEELAGGELKIVIPGRLTTANLLFSLRFPNAQKKESMLFSKIEEAVLTGKADAGVIIHENRFTYEKKGLKKIIDLGEWWEEETGCPIPLGGIAASRKLPREVLLKIDDIIRSSIRHAFANREGTMPFVRANATEMDEAVMNKHIDLYVNTYSIELGPDGRKAVELLFRKAKEKDIIREMRTDYILS